MEGDEEPQPRKRAARPTKARAAVPGPAAAAAEPTRVQPARAARSVGRLVLSDFFALDCEDSEEDFSEDEALSDY